MNRMNVSALWPVLWPALWLELRSCRGWAWRVAGVLLGLTSMVGVGEAQEGTKVLQTAAEVRRLTPEEAAEGRPVALRGVVTFFDQAHFSRFLQDGSAGIYLTQFADYPDLSAGDEIAVTGVTDSGEYAPVVKPVRVERLGRAALPEARQVALEDLASGREDSQWVEVRGIVRRVLREAGGKLPSLELATGGGRLLVELRTVANPPGEEWIDRVVRVRGVCSSSFNRGGQLFRSRLLVPREEDLMVDQMQDPDPFAKPAHPLGSLLRFAPQGSLGHRIKVAGTVVYQSTEGSLYIDDGSHGLEVRSQQVGLLQDGDVVEVLGFPATGEYTPVLEDAGWRKTGVGLATQPVAGNVDALLSGAFDSRLVALEGRLVDRTARAGGVLLVLETTGVLWSAWVENPARFPMIGSLENGSRLRVTGVCRVDVGMEWSGGEEWRARGFHLLARTPGDLVILERPSWWNLTRLLWISGLLLTGILAALTWAGLLRRKVQGQTGIIRRQLASEASLRERYQALIENADDLVYTHDARGILTSVNPACEQLLERSCDELAGKPLTDFMEEDQREAAARWLRGVPSSGETPATATEWDFLTASGKRVRLEIRTRLLPSGEGGQEVEGIARDVTERRRLEREVLEVSTREQRRIAHDLHDGICQQLAGLSYLTDILAERLEEHRAGEAAEARRISDTVNRVNAQARHLARGLFPAALEENGLVCALEELAANAAAFFHTPCEFHGTTPVTIKDDLVAHHLFYIAQEAMLNAARHGRPGRILVRLDRAGDRYSLTIEDDGPGLPPGPARPSSMGLRIMHYRARQIGANLEIQPRPGGGTLVRCTFQPFLRESVSSEKAPSSLALS